MNRIVVGIITFSLLFGAASFSGFVTAEDEDENNGLILSGGVEAGMYSKYIWRGLNLNDKGVFQPEAWLGLLGFEVGIWGNLELTDYNDRKGKFTEVDYSGSYTLEFDYLSATLIYLYYDYPNTDDEKTQEIGVALEAGEDLLVALEAYYDIDQAEGAYLKPIVAYGFELRDIFLTPSIGLGWASKKYNEYNFGAYKNSLVDLEFLLEAEADLWEGIYLTLTFSYFTLVGSDLRKEVEEGKEGFWGGGSLGFSF